MRAHYIRNQTEHNMLHHLQNMVLTSSLADITSEAVITEVTFPNKPYKKSAFTFSCTLKSKTQYPLNLRIRLYI